MGGGVSFREALRARLDIIRPSRRQVRDFLVQRPPVLTPGVRSPLRPCNVHQHHQLHCLGPHTLFYRCSELVASLQRSGVAVFLISGGFRQLIDPIQQQLSIPSGHVFANTILFDDGTRCARVRVCLHVWCVVCRVSCAVVPTLSSKPSRRWRVRGL